jgi:hypothetical protein
MVLVSHDFRLIDQVPVIAMASRSSLPAGICAEEAPPLWARVWLCLLMQM